MGRDKALLKTGNQTVLESLSSLTASIFDETLIIVNDRNKLAGLHLNQAKIYEDIIKERGPLAGIYAGLFYSRNSASCIFTCDMPFIDRALIRDLLDEWDPSFDVICFQDGEGYHQPFPGIYRRSSRELMNLLIQAQEVSMCRYLKMASVKFLSVPKERERVFTNMNTPEEYQEVLDIKSKIINNKSQINSNG
jgi:molybdopterin-guanine dinucleotide biosynthesis protein A